MFKYVVLGPAGLGFFGMLGTMQMLADTKKLDLQEISGASAGALVAFFYLLMDGDVTKILNETVSIDLKSVTKVSIRSFLSKYGFINIDGAKKKIRKICKKYMGNSNPTFLEFYEKFPQKMYISAYCISDGKTIYFSVDTHPNTKVIDALCASIAVPFLFASQEIDGKVYSDGGLGENIPAEPFLHRKGDEVCSIRVQVNSKPVNEIKDIKDYTERLVHSLLTHRRDYDTTQLKIDLGDIDLFDFKLPDKDKLKMFVQGYLIH